jgi:hypothetical protein
LLPTRPKAVGVASFRARGGVSSSLRPAGRSSLDLRTVEESVILGFKLRLCKVELAALSFALGVTEGTVLEGLRRAAEKADEINPHCTK